MSISWGDLKGYIREAILKDVVTTTSATAQFSDTQLLVAARWACVALSMHTAQPATYTITCDGINHTWALPENIVDGIEKAGFVIFDDGNCLQYLPPIRLIPGGFWPSKTPTLDMSDSEGYWEWPAGTLVLSFIPATDSRIEVRYFKIWTPPQADGSIIELPLQFEQPFAYFVGAMAFDPLGAQASAIRTWNRKSDSGTPEDNSLHQQSRYFLDMAYARLKDIGPQDRETYYRKDPRDFGFQRQ